ncbi:MAG: NTF2 fold immunity protein [Spirochaetales bacterium]|nr:NTF2 fold immunity protein [Spirochaetales bacterium]
MKKFFALLVALFFTAMLFAKRLPPPEVEEITKGNFIYHDAANYSNEHFFGMVGIESVDEPKYFYSIPIYAIEMDTGLEGDVQWKFIKSMEFKDENTITIINEKNQIFELNINTFEVKCVNTGNNVFRYKDKKCISGDVNEIYEKRFKNFVDRNANFKYNRIQPEVKKLTKLEDVVAVAEQVLFPIYGEDQIKVEQPYRISKYKDKWLVTGSLPKDTIGGVFEIVINAETSQI